MIVGMCRRLESFINGRKEGGTVESIERGNQSGPLEEPDQVRVVGVLGEEIDQRSGEGDGRIVFALKGRREAEDGLVFYLSDDPEFQKSRGARRVEAGKRILFGF